MTVRELITKIGFKVDQGSLKSAQDSVESIGKAGLMVAGMITAAVGAVGGFAIKTAADMEMLETNFTTTLGSAEKAKALMQDLNKMGAKTPFETKDLAKEAQQLINYSATGDDIIKTLTMLGDTAGGNAEKLSAVTMAYGKVQQKGKASMEELNMIGDRGIPIMGELQKMLGLVGKEGSAQLYKMVSDGRISSEMITQVFAQMTAKGGMFYKGMERASTTTIGLFSTLKDTFGQVGLAIGKELEPYTKEFLRTVTKLVEGDLGTLMKEMGKGAAEMVKGLMANLPAIINALLKIGDVIGFIKDNWGIISNIAGAIGSAALAFILMSKAMALVNLAMAIFTAHPAVLIISAIAAGAFLIIKNWEAVKTFFMTLGTFLQGVFETVGSHIRYFFESIAYRIKEDILNTVDNVKWVLGTLIKFFADYLYTILSGMNGILSLVNKLTGSKFAIEEPGFLKSMKEMAVNLQTAHTPGQAPIGPKVSEKMGAFKVNHIEIKQDNKIEANGHKASTAAAVRDAAAQGAQTAFSEELKKVLVASGA